MLFVNCLVDNPEFDSQAKERLSSPEAHFGGRCVAGAAFAKQAQLTLTAAPGPDRDRDH
tara:strand:- start:477 stop:653 length:177 start_codon:yes stop_codon:yes gene_type:complete